jgi:hypothetical protein
VLLLLLLLDAAAAAVTGSDGSQVLAHLPAAHLSDHPGETQYLMEADCMIRIVVVGFWILDLIHVIMSS